MHYHSCPICYEKPSCEMDCTIEPDLEDNGKQFGSHVTCDPCKKEKYPQLNPMLKGWDRARAQLVEPGNWCYWKSDEGYHWFLPIMGGNGLDINIVDGDFDLDFDKYNGLK